MPQKYVAIDKHMVKSRHRSGFHQFIKDKPTKWGIKLWVLAENSNGYTVYFNIYIGRAAGQTIGEHGLGYAPQISQWIICDLLHAEIMPRCIVVLKL